MDKGVFDSVPLNESKVYQIQLVRAKAYELLSLMTEDTKQSRELSLAMTKLEEALMWYNKAVSREE